MSMKIPSYQSLLSEINLDYIDPHLDKVKEKLQQVYIQTFNAFKLIKYCVQAPFQVCFFYTLWNHRS